VLRERCKRRACDTKTIEIQFALRIYENRARHKPLKEQIANQKMPRFGCSAPVQLWYFRDVLLRAFPIEAALKSFLLLFIAELNLHCQPVTLLENKSMQVSLANPKIASYSDDDSHVENSNEIYSDLSYKRIILVNVIFFGIRNAGDGKWVVIDAGIPGFAKAIIKAAEERFGSRARPAAIVLTHGHFDHVGSLEKLAERWDVPIYAHPLELPYLDGSASYPPPDPTVGGGLMSLLSSLFPRGPINVARWLKELPSDGSVPGMPHWQWIHTPGHTPGHVSLWRESDRLVIAGDAFITTQQESAYAVAVQRPEIHGPPMYYTQNWNDSHESVLKLAALEPEIAVTGHGPAIRGAEMRKALHTLADNFYNVAVPERGHYVKHPASVANGGAYR
jgi:glyoxylase-like metal-dependent hydrolase (beta-lactamase superfamily II)